MPLKKMLVIAPVQPQASDITSIDRSLSFLRTYYHIDFIDPLTKMDEVPNDAYYYLWQRKLEKYLPNYDAFMGFSFGGVILQQCFSLFSRIHKPIVLFSTPTFADSELSRKLGAVVDLCKRNKLKIALAKLYDDVYYPDCKPMQSFDITNPEDAAKRLICGLNRVLGTDSTSIIQQSSVRYLHLIGEHSNLVNANNVIATPGGRLLIVPGAGMRVLEANLPYCKQMIMEALACETQ